MTEERIQEICAHFDIDGEATGFNTLKDGHINNTYAVSWKHSDGTNDEFVLQQINTVVFKDVKALTNNILGVCEHIKKKIEAVGGDAKREVLTLIPCRDGGHIYDGCWRMYNFVKDATAHQSADAPGLLYNAAKTFGIFQRRLADYPAETLSETIPNFHNTVSRYNDFMQAVREDKAGRVKDCQGEIERIKAYEKYAHIIVDGIADGSIPLRVTHNDTKLNNIMMDNKTNEGVCVIDLDTVMPGLSAHDYGDGIRCAANKAVEDETDLSLVGLDKTYFESFTKGFVTDVMKNLTYTYFYTCGPMPMFKAIDKIAVTSGEFSFEERMGCGFGACMGCSCKTKYGSKRICKEGPVLKREEIIW